MEHKLEEVYGHRVRVRVCGLCWEDNRLLLVNHKGIAAGDFWAPPGGGVDFGMSVADTLRKEFLEETGLIIEPLAFQFGCEYIQKPIHAIELFYRVERTGGELRVGHDPEIQIIEDVRYMSPEDISQLALSELHGIFRLITPTDGLHSLTGFYTI